MIGDLSDTGAKIEVDAALKASASTSARQTAARTPRATPPLPN